MKFFVVAALVAVAAAAPSNTYGAAPSYHEPAPSYHQSSYKEPAQPYQFDYAVNHYSGAVFSQNENNDGKYVNGYYSVNLPDGRVQTVKYVADQQGYGGYNAEVTYEGQAHYDDYKSTGSAAPTTYRHPSYKPTYKSTYKPTYRPAYKATSYGR